MVKLPTIRNTAATRFPEAQPRYHSVGYGAGALNTVVYLPRSCRSGAEAYYWGSAPRIEGETKSKSGAGSKIF